MNKTTAKMLARHAVAHGYNKTRYKNLKAAYNMLPVSVKAQITNKLRRLYETNACM